MDPKRYKCNVCLSPPPFASAKPKATERNTHARSIDQMTKTGGTACGCIRSCVSGIVCGCVFVFAFLCLCVCGCVLFVVCWWLCVVCLRLCLWLCVCRVFVMVCSLVCCALFVVVEVRERPLRSGSVHCHLELAVEVTPEHEELRHHTLKIHLTTLS